MERSVFRSGPLASRLTMRTGGRTSVVSQELVGPTSFIAATSIMMFAARTFPFCVAKQGKIGGCVIGSWDLRVGIPYGFGVFAYRSLLVGLIAYDQSCLLVCTLSEAM